MDADVERMDAQLRLWASRIDHLATRMQLAGVRTRFETLVHIDELKALHAIAESKLIAFKAAALAVAARDTQRTHLRTEMERAWNELDAALNNPRPSS
jgi:hypothetical protein